MIDPVLQEALEEIRDLYLNDSIRPASFAIRAGQIAGAALAASVASHSGKQHEFRTTCRLCGEPGMLHISIIAPDETVTIATRGPKG